MEIYKLIKTAWNNTTMNCNRFMEAVQSINWDEQFTADGEFYFNKDGLLFVTETLNPFDKMFSKPSFIFEDGSYVTL